MNDISVLFQILMKWNEYSNDVQFILQRSDQPKNAIPDQAAKNPASSPPQTNESPKKAKSIFERPINTDKHLSSPLERLETIENATTESIETNERNKTDFIGIVKGETNNTVLNIRNTIDPTVFSFCRCTTYNDAKFDKNFAATLAMFIYNWNIDDNDQ